MGFFQCNKPTSGIKHFVLKASRLVNSRSVTPGWRKERWQKLGDTWESRNWLTTTLVVQRRQKVSSTSVAKTDCCTEIIDFGAVLPNWKIAIKEAPRASLHTRKHSVLHSWERNLLGQGLTTSSTDHITYLKAEHLLGSNWVVLGLQWKQQKLIVGSFELLSNSYLSIRILLSINWQSYTNFNPYIVKIWTTDSVSYICVFSIHTVQSVNLTKTVKSWYIFL